MPTSGVGVGVRVRVQCASHLLVRCVWFSLVLCSIFRRTLTVVWACFCLCSASVEDGAVAKKLARRTGN